jgi:hypothetical protein
MTDLYHPWYVLDFSTELGHQAIFKIFPKKVQFCAIDGKASKKLTLEDGKILLVDDDSSYIDLDHAIEVYKDMIKKMTEYISKDKVAVINKTNPNILIYENDNGTIITS